jgi:UDP-N-acetylmuramoyl-L-alanyl-D-glutamate--2,6-diaminopimelate ligase
MFNMAAEGVKYLIMEVSSQAIYMDRIHGISFETVAFTNLYEDHIGGAEHPTFEHYRDSKRRLFTEYLSENVIYNADDPFSEYMISECKSKKRISFSAAGNKSASIYAQNILASRNDRALGISFDTHTDGNCIHSFIPMPGSFSVCNALLALAICKTAGIDIKSALDRLEYVSAEGRFETVSLPNGATVIIDYAHNGASLTAALTALKEYSPKRLICLFGSVGGRTFGRRRELALAASSLADLCILTADNPDFESPEDVIDDIASHFPPSSTCPYVKIPDRRDAIRFAVANAENGDIVLLAGKGHEDYQLVSGKKIPFSERAIIMEAISDFSGVM